MLVTAEQTFVRDLFTRVVANGWGIATTGQTWTTAGGILADYAVNGAIGVHTFSATNAPRQTFVPVTTSTDMAGWIQVTISPLALGAPIQPSLMLRYTDASNYYFAELSLNTDNTADLRIRKVVLGVTATIAGPYRLPDVHAAGATWNIKASICGGTLTAKAWRSTAVSEPGVLLTVNDFDLLTGVNAGARSVLASGNANGATVFGYDNFVTWISDPVRIFRTISATGEETEVRGSPVFTGQALASGPAAYAVMWDGEAPFDESIYYSLKSACSDDEVAVTSPTSLEDEGRGWLRDPVDPTLNVSFEMEGFFDECVDQDVIVFSGLDAREYPNASGIFDHINARKVIGVAMTRKNLGLALTLTSFSLNDIDSLEAILDSGRVLLLSLPVEYGWARATFGTEYIAIFDVTQSLLGVDQRVTTRVWTIPFRTADEPTDTSEGGNGGNGIGGGDATYEALAASALGNTYGLLTLSGLTYLDVAQGTGY